ncbi:MAG: hybrid sensor histidine kinase/response regulator [bacterium]
MEFLEEEFEEILNIFRDESEEQIQKIHCNLLVLENNPNDPVAIQELFREAHSIKGAARMIGFLDIQAVAHKLEDIFGFAKDKKLKLNSSIIDLLCEAADCIGSIIEESIKTKGKYHSERVDSVLSRIEGLINSVQNGTVEEDFIKPAQISTEKKVEEPEIINDVASDDIEAQTQLNKDASFAIFKEEVLSLSDSIKKLINGLKYDSSNFIVLNALHNNINHLDELGKYIDEFEITEILFDIKTKLDGVIRGSGLLIDSEVIEVEENFNSFLKKVAPEVAFQVDILSDAAENIQVLDRDDISVVKDEEDLTAKSAKIISKANQFTFKDDIEFISYNLICFADTSSEALKNIELIIEKLLIIINKISNEDIKKIFEKIIELAELAKMPSTKPSVEVVDVIKQSFDSAISFVIEGENDEDPFLVFQRLSILQQMLKMSENESGNLQITEEQQENKDNTELQYRSDYAPVLPSIDIFAGGQEKQGQKISDTFKTNDNATIKTLRVDAKKLDQLVSQAGELIIANIKAKDHLVEIEKIIRSVEEWQREWNKSKQQFKNLERKSFKPSDIPSGTSIYLQNKSVASSFEETSSKINDFLTKINSLYKVIHEDDARLNLIVNEIEEKIKSVRVLPLATVFHMLPRMVRDISRDVEKEIEFIISGSETSVDKKIIEEIKDPLIHIIRNAIDHGIEKPADRIKKGKSPVGKIFLNAYPLENSVQIDIIDDGRGIDLEAIRRKVLQKGLLNAAELQAMNDDQIMNIIFWPGFSTGEIVTDISGRGVGLDIVYTKITQINGKVSIMSTLGEGCKVSIQLPVTMATIKSFLVKVNSQTFAIPTSAIKTALLINPKHIFYKEGRETIIVDNKTVPICRLSRILEMPEASYSDKVVVIIIQAEDVQVGFIIDKLVGDQEILHKNLTPPLIRVRNVAGVTTLGSGELCLILNVSDLVKSAYSYFGMSQKQLVMSRDNTSLIRKSILVVDDSVTTRILERNILRAAGYNVTVAVNGLDALTKLSSERFDLVVTDVEMPEINGFELTERIRRDDKNRELPIILVTSLASEVDKRKGLALGANAYITKGSFDQDDLLDAIRKLIG